MNRQQVVQPHSLAHLRAASIPHWALCPGTTLKTLVTISLDFFRKATPEKYFCYAFFSRRNLDVKFNMFQYFSPFLQKLLTVGGLLKGSSINVAWIGAKDLADDDEIKFVRYDETINVSFCANGEPNHQNGNCATVVAISTLYFPIVLADCDTQLPVLCEADRVVSLFVVDPFRMTSK